MELWNTSAESKQILLTFLDLRTPSITQTPIIYHDEMIAALQCWSDAFPSPRFVWKKDGFVVHQGASYSVSNANLSHAGEYVCEASNAARVVTARTNVELLCKYSKKETFERF